MNIFDGVVTKIRNKVADREVSSILGELYDMVYFETGDHTDQAFDDAISDVYDLFLAYSEALEKIDELEEENGRHLESVKQLQDSVESLERQVEELADSNRSLLEGRNFWKEAADSSMGEVEYLSEELDRLKPLADILGS